MTKEKKGIGLASAFRGITRFYIPGREGKNMASAAYWYSFVGLFLGVYSIAIPSLLNYLLVDTVNYNKVLLSLIWGVLSVVALAFGTRGFHLDGFADTLDGFGGGFNREKIMEIMKDSRVGSFGTIGIVSILLIKTIAFSILFYMNFKIIILCIIASRVSLVFLCLISHYAKPNGLARELVDGVKISHLLFNLLFLGLFWQNIPELIISLLTVVLISLYTKHISYKKIDGITGDILGFNLELTETILAIVLALFYFF